MATTAQPSRASGVSLHRLGVICGLAAGAGLGAAEAPTKLVTTGLSPFLISLGMVAGVFVARWTVPMVLKGGDYVWADLRQKRHLVVWALLAGMIWAVANTLTVFAIRDVGLSIAFPLWNTNSLVGLFWGAGGVNADLFEAAVLSVPDVDVLLRLNGTSLQFLDSATGTVEFAVLEVADIGA